MKVSTFLQVEHFVCNVILSNLDSYRAFSTLLSLSNNLYVRYPVQNEPYGSEKKVG